MINRAVRTCINEMFTILDFIVVNYLCGIIILIGARLKLVYVGNVLFCFVLFCLLVVLVSLLSSGARKCPKHTCSYYDECSVLVHHITHSPEEPRVLSHYVHDVGSHNGFVVLPSLLLTET